MLRSVQIPSILLQSDWKCCFTNHPVVVRSLHQQPKGVNRTTLLLIQRSLLYMLRPLVERSLSLSMAAEASIALPAETTKMTATAMKHSAAADDGGGNSSLSSYLGLSFLLFLGSLPKSSISFLSSLQSRNRILAMKLFEAEDQLRQLRSRRKEDAKANARVAEILAGHRNGWQQEERRLLQRNDAASAEIAALRDRIEEIEQAESELRAAVEGLERQVAERDELIDFMARKLEREGDTDAGEDLEAAKDESVGSWEERVKGGRLSGDHSSARASQGLNPLAEDYFSERNSELEEATAPFPQQSGSRREFMTPPAEMKPWIDRLNAWQDMQYDSLAFTCNMKNFVAREYPWKADAETSGASSKLKFLEQELSNIEKIGTDNLSNIPSLMRKQAKLYQSLTGKIDDLCRRMQAKDPCDLTLSPEFRTQRQTEFLHDAFCLQNRAKETRQRLHALQAEAAKCSLGEEMTAQAKLSMRKSLDSMRTNFKEIQRNLEIWLARIMGDLEGILARDGASRANDYYSSPYPHMG